MPYGLYQPVKPHGSVLAGTSPRACIVSVLGREEGCMVKYNPLPEGVPEGDARGNS